MFTDGLAGTAPRLGRTMDLGVLDKKAWTCAALGVVLLACVWAAADGESGVLLSFAGVLRYDGVETESLIEEGAKEFEILQLLEGWVSTIEAGDFGL